MEPKKFKDLLSNTGTVYQINGLKTRNIVKITEIYMGYNAFDISTCEVIHIPPETECHHIGRVSCVH
jgi:hypothetical protein